MALEDMATVQFIPRDTRADEGRALNLEGSRGVGCAGPFFKSQAYQPSSDPTGEQGTNPQLLDLLLSPVKP